MNPVYNRSNRSKKSTFGKGKLATALTFALAATTTLVLAAERSEKFTVNTQQMQALNIQVQVLKRDAEPVVLTAPAQVTVPINNEQVVSSPLGGLAVKLHVQPNQPVLIGASLLTIASQEFGALQLQLLQASSQATLAKQTAEREQALFAEGIIPQRRAQEALSAQKESEAALKQATAALRLAGLPAAAIARIASSGELEDALTLHATQAGTVIEINVKPGQRVEPMTELMHVAQTDKLALDIQVASNQSAAWKVGATLSLQNRAGSGHVTSVSPVVSNENQSVLVRAELDSNARDLRPGEFVTVMLPLPTTSETWDVPLASLAYDDMQAHVFVKTATGFEARAVTIVVSAGQRVRIQGSLNAGETIAVSGVVALKGSWLGETGAD